MDRPNLFRKTAYFLLLALGLWLFFFLARPSFNVSTTDSDIIAGFIEWFGVLYGLLMAMLLVEVWTNYNRVVEEIDKEADALQMLYWTAQYLRREDATRRIGEAIAAYAELMHNTRGFENEAQRQTAEQYLRVLHQAVGEAITESEHMAICAELLARVNEARDTRGDRLAHARNRVHPVLWGALIVTSAIWILSFFGLRIESLVVSLFIDGAATLAVVILLLIIRDLSLPFEGVMIAKFQSFETLCRSLNQD